MKEIKIDDETIDRTLNSFDKKKLKIIKYTALIIFFPIVLFVIGKITFNILFPSTPDYSNVRNSEFFSFPDLLPKVNTSVVVSSLDELFSLRQIFINDIDITKDYILKVRKINSTEDEKFNPIYSQTEMNFTADYFQKRNSQMNYTQFIILNQEESIIDTSPIEYDNKPLISIIICVYNNKDYIIKSIRSVQNQSLRNIEIIIVDDGSTDNNTRIYQFLVDTDPRVRIFYHMHNLGLWRARIDGVLYSNGKYVIFFDPDDYYEDNYVLEDLYNLMEKYNLDSVKMGFRMIGDYSKLNDSKIPYKAGDNSKIVYGSENIENYDSSIFGTSGNIWNRLIRANVFIKALNLLSDKMLNMYQNMRDDFYFNKITSKASNNLLIVDRIGYVYYYDGKGFGTPKNETEEQKDSSIQQFVSELTFEYFFLPKEDNKETIISKLKEYDNENSKFQLKFFRNRFYILYNLINILLEDPSVSKENKDYLNVLLAKSKIVEKESKTKKRRFFFW